VFGVMEEDYPRDASELERRFSRSSLPGVTVRLRWQDGFRCPRCEAGKSWALQSGRVQCAGCGYQVSMTAGTVFRIPNATDGVVRANVVADQPEERVSALALQRVLGWGSYQTAWTCLHKLRRAMIRPGASGWWSGRSRRELSGRRREGRARSPHRRQGAGCSGGEEDGRGIGRIRLRHIQTLLQPD